MNGKRVMTDTIKFTGSTHHTGMRIIAYLHQAALSSIR